MKKILINYGGVILFYLVIVLGVMFMNYDTNSLQKTISNNNSNIVSK